MLSPNKACPSTKRDLTDRMFEDRQYQLVWYVFFCKKSRRLGLQQRLAGHVLLVKFGPHMAVPFSPSLFSLAWMIPIQSYPWFRARSLWGCYNILSLEFLALKRLPLPKFGNSQTRVHLKGGPVGFEPRHHHHGQPSDVFETFRPMSGWTWKCGVTMT